MSDAPSAFPLQWPAGKPRTNIDRRKRGQFQADGRPITRIAAVEKVRREVAALGGVYPLISSNLELRKDGMPRLDRAEPYDAGICLFFSMKGRPYAMACDTYSELAQNIAAVANHIEATRRIERYGVATAAETLQAFQTLPAPKRPHEILGVAIGATSAEIKAAWRARIADAHPDRTGSHDAAAEVNAARDAMLGPQP